mgnify:CR=1 FL=1
MNVDPDRYVILGQVAGVFGVKGWVKIRSETDPPKNILNYSTWYLSKGNDWQAHELVQGQQHNKGLIAQLAGCEDRDAAASLVGNRIAVLRSQLPELHEDEYYWSDLIGLKVYNLNGQYLGIVDHLLETGANDVLVIKAEKGEILVPYVQDYYVQSIDLDAGSMTVDWEESEE